MVSQTSRYSKTGTLVLKTPEGEETWYFRRRFIPDPGKDPPLAVHTVSQGERPDIVAARYLGNPELYWRLCDANTTFCPEDLTRTLGKRVLVPQIRS